MFVKAWSMIWIREKMFMFAQQAKSRKVVFFSEDSCHSIEKLNAKRFLKYILKKN